MYVKGIFKNCFFVFLVGYCASVNAVTELAYSIVDQKDHDSRSFTQGLVLDHPRLYESSGLYGRSRVFYYDVNSSVETQTQSLPASLFAEGLTKVGPHLFLLTWHAGIAFKLDALSLDVLQQFSYQGQGWGLTYNGKQLIRSDGTHLLHYHHPESFKRLKSVPVHMDNRPLTKINELEYVNGYLWANIWMQDFIVKIDPATGEVLARLDLSALSAVNKKTEQSVLNGIAYDRSQDAFWVTGKFWSKRYLIKIREPGSHY